MRGLRFALLSVLLLAACGDDGASAPDAGSPDAMPAPPGAVTFEVAHYDYRFDLEGRGATSVLTIEVTGSGDCLSLPMRVYADSVAVEGSVLRSIDRVDDVLTVCSDLGWLAGEEITLTVQLIIPLATWNETQVGYSVELDVENQPFHYLVSWVGGCDRFGPCDNRPDRFATYRFTVTHPEGTTVLCPGTITPGTTETRCEFAHAGGPTYSTFGVAASPSWQPMSLGSWGSVEVTLYDTPSSGIAAAFDADLYAGFLGFMETTFGPYPYGTELRFAVGPTYWNGFEHPGNIVLYDGLEDQASSYANPLDHTTMHEIAHQWAGDQTTLADTYDFVWKEAMAEYLTYLFEDQTDPAVGEATVRTWKARGRFAAYYPVPTQEPRPTLLQYYGHVYSAGPMILFRQLEALYSRDAVIEALQSLLGEPRAIGVADLHAALEAATGADLQNYFDTWVYGAGDPSWPLYDVTVVDQGAGTYDVTVALAAGTTGTWGSAFAVQLTGEDGETHDVWFDLGPDGTVSDTVTATGVPFAVTGHVFDPHAHTLARENGSTVAPLEGDINPWIHD
jgi:aminopeptidase N